jgi:phosphohistidine phosphatase
MWTIEPMITAIVHRTSGGRATLDLWPPARDNHRVLKLLLVHHAQAVGPEVDPRRPLSADGLRALEQLAAEAARRGARPTVVWHSGKLRARQTAEEFWRACNALAEFSATRDLQPDDPPEWIRDRLRAESRDILIAGHFPHLPRLLTLLVPSAGQFPLHGAVALGTEDDGATWQVIWKLEVKS